VLISKLSEDFYCPFRALVIKNQILVGPEPV